MKPHSPISKDASLRPSGRISQGFETQGAIEAYLDRLNSQSPLARRRVTQWGRSGSQSLRLGAVPLAPADPASDAVFMAEAETSFGLEVQAHRAVAAGAPYSVGLLLAGSMQVTLAGGEFVARAGEGIIIDPSQVERTQLATGSHFVEFMLPRTSLLRLGAELDPGGLAGSPQFAPWLPSPLAQRLLAMARQTAEVLRPDRPAHGVRVMYARWMELIALTLLQEHRPASVAMNAAQVSASPRSLSRALDYIDAHAQEPILLADIAAAACVSASALLRQFKEHVGQSPGAFLRQVRLDRAHAELRSGAAGSIREVAQRWGFQSASKFSAAFRRRFGEGPMRARAGR